MSGEAASRAELDLPGVQERLLEAVQATGTPVVLVVNSGRPLTIAWAAEHVPAIVESWFLGVETGPALAAVLRSEEHTSELQSQSNLVCRLLLAKKKTLHSSLCTAHSTPSHCERA